MSRPARDQLADAYGSHGPDSYRRWAERQAVQSSKSPSPATAVVAEMRAALAGLEQIVAAAEQHRAVT